MAILSASDHRILSVGTFGWWGAWLAKKGNTIYQNEFASNANINNQVELRGYYPPDWIMHPMPQKSSGPQKSTATIVTAYFTIASKHTHEEYLSWMTNALSIKDPMVIFTSVDMAPVIRQLRSHAMDRTRIVITAVSELRVARQFSSFFWLSQFRLGSEARLHSSYELYMAREKPTELSTTWVDKTRHACYVAGASMAGTVAAWPEFFEAFKLTIDGYVDRGLCIGEDQAVIQTTCTRHLSLCRFVLPGQMQGDPWFGMLWALHHGVNVDTL
eukprot:gene722-1186_t